MPTLHPVDHDPFEAPIKTSTLVPIDYEPEFADLGGPPIGPKTQTDPYLAVAERFAGRGGPAVARSVPDIPSATNAQSFARGVGNLAAPNLTGALAGDPGAPAVDAAQSPGAAAGVAKALSGKAGVTALIEAIAAGVGTKAGDRALVRKHAEE